MIAYPKLTELVIIKNRAESSNGLFQDLLAVDNEQKVVMPGILVPEALIVKCRYDSLSGTCRSNHKVAEAVSDGTLYCQLFEYLLLLGADGVFLQKDFSFSDCLLVF